MLLSEMLKPKKQKEAKVKFIKIMRDGSLLYENIKTKTLYLKKDNSFYNMKNQELNYNFIEV